MEILVEFDKQVQNLLDKGYPDLAGISKDKFLKLLAPLKNKVRDLDGFNPDFEKGHLPLVIVVKSNLVPVENTMSLVEKDAKKGITKLFPLEPKDFQVIDDEKIPDSEVYLLFDIDRGQENINLPPSEAMKIIRDAGRYPLTIEEGIAIVTHYPEFLAKNNCFSLLASRHPGDKRVPAIWINGKKHPNLGWCWDGNPHTWLGSASCGKRVGSEE